MESISKLREIIFVNKHLKQLLIEECNIDDNMIL